MGQRGENMNSFELTTAITVVANVISNGLSLEETALLASVFVQIGDTLATIAAGIGVRDAKSDKADSKNLTNIP